jgi:hypothetical protein
MLASCKVSAISVSNIPCFIYQPSTLMPLGWLESTYLLPLLSLVIPKSLLVNSKTFGINVILSTLLFFKNKAKGYSLGSFTWDCKSPPR